MTELAQSCGTFAADLSANVTGEHLVGLQSVLCIILKYRFKKTKHVIRPNINKYISNKS